MPALNGGRADLVRTGEFSLSDTAMVRLEYFQTVFIRGAETRLYPGKAILEITPQAWQ